MSAITKQFKFEKNLNYINNHHKLIQKMGVLYVLAIIYCNTAVGEAMLV